MHRKKFSGWWRTTFQEIWWMKMIHRITELQVDIWYLLILEYICSHFSAMKVEGWGCNCQNWNFEKQSHHVWAQVHMVDRQCSCNQFRWLKHYDWLDIFIYSIFHSLSIYELARDIVQYTSHISFLKLTLRTTVATNHLWSWTLRTWMAWWH